MPREFSRTARVSHAIQRVLGPLIDEVTRESKLGLVSVTEVDVSPDLRRSTVYVSVFGDADNGDDVVDALQEQAAAFRFELGRQLRLKNTPALQFRLDSSLEQGDRMSRLLNDTSDPEQ